MKRTVLIPILLALLLGVISIVLYVNRPPEYTYTNPEEAAGIMRNAKVIVHAGGRLNEETGYPFDGSNSMDGLVKAYENGCRTIELDFSFTADGALACIHDWHATYSSAIQNNVPLTLDEFLSCRIYNRYEPMWLGTLADFMREHEDVIIVTDIKDDNIRGAAAIAEHCPDLMNRFVIQIYEKSEYDDVRELGFEYVIFTLYRLGWQEKTNTRALKRFAKYHPLVGYTFSYELCEEKEGYLEGMLKTGVPLFVHTINDPVMQQTYYNLGITGIYTDIAEP